MRFAFVFAPLGLLLSLVTMSASARAPLPPVSQEPANIEEVQTTMNQTIPQYLEQSQCGGYNLGETVEGKISIVTGVPGRRGQWNGAILSGMGVRRDDSFTYPQSTTGLSTSCWNGFDEVVKWVWRPVPNGRPNEVTEIRVTYDHPYFLDPPCRWRILKVNQAGERTYLSKAPNIPLVDDNPKTPDKYIYEEYQEDFLNRQSPETCMSFCPYLNSFQYSNCAEPVGALDETVDPPEFYMTCPERRPSNPNLPNMTNFFLCTDTPVDNNAESCAPGNLPTEWPNSRTCTGNSCACPGPGCANAPNGDIYYSYYRRYEGNYVRESVPKEPEADVNTRNAQVACYGFYKEFDPRYQRTSYADHRCVINMDVSMMRTTQLGKGTYGEDTAWPDPDPTQSQNQRKNGIYDQNNDLWFEKLGRSFSLLNEKVFHTGSYVKNLSQVYLGIDKLDRGDLMATPQLGQQRPFAQSANIRAFDDTGEPRTVATWWQKQQQEVAELTHRSAVRLLLPTGWAFGVDLDDPLFTRFQAKTVSGEAGQSQRVELQIDAEEDTLGAALGYIERSLLLHVQEEPIPVVVPLGSPTEYRALAQTWCSWYIIRANKENCDDAPLEIQTLIAQLEGYADQIEKVRELRAELANYAGTILTLQQEIIRPISDWVESNIDAYLAILEEQQNMRALIDSEWQPVARLMNDFHDRANQPWCMNQRYTTPIYSLLDPWMPSRSEQGSVRGGMPNLTARRPADIFIDFSTITYMPDPLSLPVLQPIQIRATNIPRPPNTGAILPLPPLPDIDAIQEKIRETLVNLPDPPTNPPKPALLSLPSSGTNIEEVQTTIRTIGNTVARMRDEYTQFWESLGPITPQEIAQDNALRDGASESKEKMAAFRNSVPEMKRRLECKNWYEMPCVHVEMDLLERFTRIGSRPDVQLKEDYDSQGAARGFGSTCMPHDDSCVPVHPESTAPGGQWDIIGPQTQEKFINDLRTNVRDLTLPPPGGQLDSQDVPPYVTSPQDLLPLHDVPSAIDLVPPSSTQ